MPFVLETNQDLKGSCLWSRINMKPVATNLPWFIFALFVFAGASCKAQPQNSQPKGRTVSPEQSVMSNAEAQSPGPIDFELHFERTGCLGMCPTYELHVDGSGAVVWIGHANVQALGKRNKVVSPEVLRELVANLHAARFFELNSEGQVPTPTTRSTDANGRTIIRLADVVICSDTSHSMTKARVGKLENSVDNAHCQQGGMDLFEAQVDKLLEAEEWIGPDTLRAIKLNP